MTGQTRVQRSSERKRVLMNATIIDADGTHQVRVVDLNSLGARIACTRVIPVGEDLIFRRGGLFIAARVAWSKRDGAGLQFYREIPASEIASTFHPVFEALEAAE
jgi:hypothetical protein